MGLKYRKQYGKKNNYSTITKSSKGTKQSHTVKNGSVTSTTNMYGTRITSNLGGGWSNTKYIPNGRAATKRAMRKSMSQLRKMNKRGSSKLINPIYLIPVLLLTGLFNKLDSNATHDNYAPITTSDSSENTNHLAVNARDKDSLSNDLAKITDPNDLSYIKSSLASAFRLGTQARFVNWYNPDNQHQGTVAMNTGAQTNAECQQFTVRRTDSQHLTANDLATANTIYCSDSTIK